MRKIKIFTDANETEMEDEINEWLIERPAIIVHNILQSESCVGDEDDSTWSLTITIFYYEGEGHDTCTG